MWARGQLRGLPRPHQAPSHPARLVTWLPPIASPCLCPGRCPFSDGPAGVSQRAAGKARAKEACFSVRAAWTVVAGRA